jgi:S1-C subfamily serine protease
MSEDPTPHVPFGDETPPSSPLPGWRRRRATGLLAPLAAAAVLGGGVAAATIVAVNGDGTTRTVTQTVAQPAVPAVDAAATPTTPTSGGTKSIEQIYADDARGVVNVAQSNGQGSGFVIDRDGYIITNAHVVDGGDTAQVSFADNESFTAKVVGRDQSTDVALLKVNAPAAALHPIELGSSSALKVGDQVVAIGNPFGLDRSASTGIVSALGRTIEAPNGFTITGAVQTDAAINHGNSGGPLLNMQGQVVGITAQIAQSGVDANVGVGFAVPIDTVKTILGDLKAHGSVAHAYLGVRIDTVDATLASAAHLSVDHGAMIAGVVSGGPADKAGLKAATRQTIIDGQQYAVGGDIVTAVDGQAVTSSDDLSRLVSEHRAGDRVRLTVIGADGKQRSVDVTLGTQPAEASSQQQQQSPQGGGGGFQFPTP